MSQSRTEMLILMLMGIVILLMVAIGGLFFRMMELQRAVLATLQPFQAVEAPEGLAVGSPAPGFTLPDTEGQEVSLADFAGQRLLLVFASPHCPACREMYPHLKAFSAENPEIQVVMISNGTAEENRRLVEEQGFGFPVLLWEDAVAGAYRVPGTPFFYVVDGEGVIVGEGFAGTREQLEELVKTGGE